MLGCVMSPETHLFMILINMKSSGKTIETLLLFFTSTVSLSPTRNIMSRGNQREKAREKNQKKKDAEKKKQDGDPKKRLEAQAEIMRKKQAEADAKKAAQKA